VSGEPFAVAPDGLQFAAGDGPELLTWRNDGAPTWKVFGEGILVGVVFTLSEVVTLDADGRLSRFRRSDGDLVSTTQIRQRALALGVSPDATRVLVVTPDGPLVDSPQGLRLVPSPGTSAAGFGPGEAIGIGHQDGTFTAMEIQSGAAWGSVKADGPVAGVAWSTLGCWVLGVGRLLQRVSGDGKNIEARIQGAEFAMDLVAVSANGVIAAARAGDRVELYELHKNRPVGEFLLRRPIGGIGFGPGLMLAIGLDDGDGNWIELATGATFRTEPHPGHGRSTWRLENKCDLGMIRGAIAFQQAGKTPIARYVQHGKVVEEEPPRNRYLAGCISVLSFVFGVSFLCGGLLLVMYILRTYDLLRYLPLR
jgi:hypothetical protein